MECPMELFGPNSPVAAPIGNPYVSCIKIHGRPILPPLLSEERRQEMVKLRRAASTLEELIITRRRSSCSSDGLMKVENHSTPSRPATLDLSMQIKTPKNNRLKNTLEHHLARNEIDTETEDVNKRWSPLELENVPGIMLKIGADSDSTQDTPETVTASPHVFRQNSYTLLSPSPALLDYLATQKRAESGRKTWDLRQAQQEWSRDLDSESDDSSVVFNNCRSQGASIQSTPRRLQVPSKVPLNRPEPLKQSDNVPCDLEENINKLSIMMTSLKLRHEEQRRQLEDKQRIEQEQFEAIIRGKMADIITATKRIPRSASSCRADQLESRTEEFSCVSEPAQPNLPRRQTALRPKSARDPSYYRKRGGTFRTRSADRLDESICQDTDIDVSFQDDFIPGKVAARRNDDYFETWSFSSRSRSSTISTDAVPIHQRNGCQPKVAFKYYGDFERYQKAATKICAAAKGFLTRRLMRTEYVYSLYRSLRDTNHLVKSLKNSDDLCSGDLEFMTGLTRQIHSNWHAIYEVFLLKEPREQMEIIAADRGRLRSARSKTPTEPGRKISAATMKSISRRQMGMSTSLTGLPRSGSFSRSCFKMSASLSGALPPRRPSYK